LHELPAAALLFCFFFFSSRRRHTRSKRDWSSDVCSSDLDRPLDIFNRYLSPLLTLCPILISFPIGYWFPGMPRLFQFLHHRFWYISISKRQRLSFILP